MDIVQTELFIDEVRKREAIWNSASDAYKDRTARRNQWMELCVLFNPKFEEQTAKEKSATCQDLQAKWRNLRDAYVRFVRENKTKSGKARKKVKSYVHAKNLEFLNTCNNSQPTESSLIEDEDNENNEESDIDYSNSDIQSPVGHVEKETPDITSVRSASTVHRKRKADFQWKLEKYIDVSSQRAASTEDKSSDDMDFFRSLLPTLNAMPMQEKLRFRRDVLNTLVGYAQNPQPPFMPPFPSNFYPFALANFNHPPPAYYNRPHQNQMHAYQQRNQSTQMNPVDKNRSQNPNIPLHSLPSTSMTAQPLKDPTSHHAGNTFSRLTNQSQIPNTPPRFSLSSIMPVKFKKEQQVDSMDQPSPNNSSCSSEDFSENEF